MSCGVAPVPHTKPIHRDYTNGALRCASRLVFSLVSCCEDECGQAESHCASWVMSINVDVKADDRNCGAELELRQWIFVANILVVAASIWVGQPSSLV